MNQEIVFRYQTKVSDMYRFLMYHAYIGISGIINLIISIGALALLFTGAGQGYLFNNALLILIASLFTIINPIFLYYKAAKQVKLTPMFQKPLDYVVNQEGIKVAQGEEEILLSWSDIHKVVETRSAFIFYMSMTRAHILPKEGYANQVDVMRSIIQTYATDSIRRIKKSGEKQ